MSKNENIQLFVQGLVEGKSGKVKDLLEQAIAEKATLALEEKKMKVAQHLFATTTEE